MRTVLCLEPFNINMYHHLGMIGVKYLLLNTYHATDVNLFIKVNLALWDPGWGG